MAEFFESYEVKFNREGSSLGIFGHTLGVSVVFKGGISNSQTILERTSRDLPHQ
jgi:hypothetical protein